MIEMTRADLARAGRQHVHRTRNPLREVQPEPRGAHENQERHHQEQGEVDAFERTLQDPKLTVVLVRLGDAPGMTREIAGKKVAGDDDAHRGSVRVTGEGARANELASRIERLVRLRVGAARRHPRCQQIGRRPHVPARQRRRLSAKIATTSGRGFAGSGSTR